MAEVSPFGDVLCRDVRLSNSVHSDNFGERDTSLIFRGFTEVGQEHVLGSIRVYHDPSGGEQHGHMDVALNSGTDDDSPTSVLSMNTGDGFTVQGKGTFSDSLHLTKSTGDGLVVSSAADISGSLAVGGTTTIDGLVTLTKASGDALSVVSDATLGGVVNLTKSSGTTLQVSGDSEFEGAVSLTKASGTALNVTANAEFGGNTAVNGVLTLSKNSGTALDIAADAQVGGTVTLTKASGTSLNVVSDAQVGGTITLTKASGTALDITADTQMAGALTLSKASGTALHVTADTQVDGDTTLAGSVVLTKSTGTALSVIADAQITGNLTIDGELFVDGFSGSGSNTFEDETVHNGGIDVNDDATFSGTITLDGANPVVTVGVDSSLTMVQNDTGDAKIQIHGSAEAAPNQIDIDAAHLYLPANNTVGANGGIRGSGSMVLGCDTDLLPAGAVDWTNDIGGGNLRCTPTASQLRLGTATIMQVEAAQILLNQQVKFNLAGPIIDGGNTSGTFRLGNNALMSSIDIYGTSHATKMNQVEVNSQVLGVHAIGNFHDLVISNAHPTTTAANKGFLIERYENDVVADGNPESGEDGTAQSATLSTIKLDPTASPTNNYYRGWVIELTAGSGNGLSRKITQYDGVSKVATVSFDWSILPDATSQYVMHKDSYVGFTYDESSTSCSLSVVSANTVNKTITPTSQVGLQLSDITLTSGNPSLTTTDTDATLTMAANNSSSARIDIHGSAHASKADQVDVVGDTTINGNLDVTTDLYVAGDLIVDGNTTSISSTTLQVEDKNIELGNAAAPTDITADGGGITLKGDSDKTILWENDHDNWQSSEHWSVAENKSYQINNTTVLDSTTLNLDAENTSGATGAVMFGDANTDGSMRMRADNNVIYLETRVAGTWIPKHKFKMS